MRFVPVPTPETSHYWESVGAGTLSLPRCRTCTEVFFPPRNFCPSCHADQVEYVPVSGTGTLVSYVVNERVVHDFSSSDRQVIALVKLEEGVTLMGNVLDAPIPTNTQAESGALPGLPLGVRMRIVLKEYDGVVVPMFELE